MIRDRTPLTRLARQAMRRGDSADATRWIRAAALVQPIAARPAKPASAGFDQPIDHDAKRERVKGRLDDLIARMEREIAERAAEQNQAEANSC